MVGIEDKEIAFAFDLECNEILTEWEIESEQKRQEVLIASVLLGPKSVTPSSDRTATKKFSESTF